MRQGQHPGPPLEPRRLSLQAESAGEYRVRLAPGSELHAAVIAAAVDLGLVQATVSLLSGSFDRFSYLTGQPDASGQRLATYGAPTLLDGPVTLIGANGLIGSDPEGRALFHCHCVVADAQGQVHGGHLPPEACVVGAGGLTLHLLGLAKAGFRVAYDSETNYPIFHPKALEAAA
ncbi:MAG: hypothetical protein Kilf2KO_02850 [Rhodospirillales bacterium]